MAVARAKYADQSHTSDQRSVPVTLRQTYRTHDWAVDSPTLPTTPSDDGVGRSRSIDMLVITDVRTTPRVACQILRRSLEECRDSQEVAQNFHIAQGAPALPSYAALGYGRAPFCKLFSQNGYDQAGADEISLTSCEL